MRNSSRWLLILLTLVSVHFAEAQQAGKIPRIGMVSSGTASNPGPTVAVLRQGLRDLGYVEGKNILLEYRFYEGVSERNPTLVAELVKLNVDVLVSVQTPRIVPPRRRLRRFPLSW